jgi:hypothetical protein
MGNTFVFTPIDTYDLDMMHSICEGVSIPVAYK